MDAELIIQVIIYAGTLGGLLLTPPFLEKNKWIFFHWFLVFNLFLFSGAWKYHFFGLPVVYGCLTQLPWLAVCIFLCGVYRKHPSSFNTSRWSAWAFTRITVMYLLLYLPADLMSPVLILSVVLPEVLLGAASLMYWKPGGGAGSAAGNRQRDPRGWFFVAWNVVGFASAWHINYKIHWLPVLKSAQPTQWDITTQFSQFPQIWYAGFWVPVLLCIHGVNLYAYVAGGAPVKRSPVSPD